MNIVICDDEKSTCAELENILLNYALERGVKLHVDVFFSGDALNAWLNRGENLDILFLDIELPGINGIMIGDYIRRVLENEHIFIIYISSKKNYALQLFKNRPFDFLVKPLTEQSIYQVLDNIYQVALKSNAYFQYQSNGEIYRIPYRDILYFQSTGRQINIVMNKDIKKFYGKLDNIQKKIPKHIFLNIHKSYLINYNYVIQYTYEWVKMLNGDTLNISRVNRASIRKEILEREMNEYNDH